MPARGPRPVFTFLTARALDSRAVAFTERSTTTSVWEERWHPLREEWVVVAAHRQNRPWIGETVDRAARAVPAFDPSCTFCPGNTRVSGARNPDYRDVYVFDNDHPCVGPEAPEPAAAPA